MTDIQNAINWIKEYTSPKCDKCIFKCGEKCDKDYCACEDKALKIAISALEKQIPKKPYDESKVRMTWYSECNCCKKQLPYVVWHDNMNYCPNCGQAIDWSAQEHH